MLLWVLFALMTAAVIVAVLRPLTRDGGPDPLDDRATDVALYRAQLAEIDTDLARGVIGSADAELARREIARRLLAREEAAVPVARSMSMRTVIGSVAAVLPIAALGLYLGLGAPDQPDRPLAATTRPLNDAPVADLVAKVEQRLAQRPDDGQGWDVIAPVYFRLQRFTDAAYAYQRAAVLLGESPARLAGFAEATVMAANGVVTEPARAAWERIRTLEPQRLEPRFWLALALEQDGKLAQAAAAYRALLAEGPADARWRPDVEARLAAVEPTAARGTPAKGPTAADVAAAGQMDASAQAEMIRGMVEGLAQRLAANPADRDGWLRLVRSYAVIGDKAKAKASLADARRHLAKDAAALADLDALARSLGLGS
jgi:cytochrome c-type biogenesis protein CcmH